MIPLTPLHFVTSNPNKVREVERIVPLPVVPLSADLPEIQAATLEEIALRKLERALELGRLPAVVEDVALGFLALGGFPGPYVKWLLHSAGGEGLGAIARGLEDRTALAHCCLAWSDGSETRVFLGSTLGRILTEPRGERHFGWDPWFVPEGSGKTYAEMGDDEKDGVSHRSIAWRKLASFLVGKVSAEPR